MIRRALFRILDRLSRLGVPREQPPRTDICVMFGGVPCGQHAVTAIHGKGICGPHLQEFGEIAADVTATLRDAASGASA